MLQNQWNLGTNISKIDIIDLQESLNKWTFSNLVFNALLPAKPLYKKWKWNKNEFQTKNHLCCSAALTDRMFIAWRKWKIKVENFQTNTLVRKFMSNKNAFMKDYGGWNCGGGREWLDCDIEERSPNVNK